MGRKGIERCYVGKSFHRQLMGYSVLRIFPSLFSVAFLLPSSPFLSFSHNSCIRVRVHIYNFARGSNSFASPTEMWRAMAIVDTMGFAPDAVGITLASAT